MAKSLVLAVVILSLGFQGLQAFTSTPSAPARVRTALSASAAVEFAALDGLPEAAPEQFDQYVMKTYGRYPISMTRGEGVKLWDSTGKEYLDFVAGISTCILGHSNADLKQAVSDQMNAVHHVSNLYYIPKQGLLAKWLVDHSPANKVFFCNSGAEANEAAIKLARKHAHTQLGLDLPVIITAKQSFHGRTLAAITATGQPKYQANFGPMVPGFEYTPYNDVAALRDLVKRIQRGNGLNRLVRGGKKRGVAAIMLESLQGEGGIRAGTPEFFAEARRLCDETGALLICDEVQVGMGRSGKMWGFNNVGVEPDVFTLAKALGGGVPIGAMCCKASCDVFTPGDHAATFGGNPLACAAGLAVGRALDSDGFLDNVSARGDQLRAGLRQLQQDFPEVVLDVRGWGLINGLELNANAGITASEVVAEAIAGGLLLVPAGTHVVRFVPPLVVTESEVAAAVDMLRSVVTKLATK